jgi:hypothetical protein
LRFFAGQATLRWGGTIHPGQDLVQPGAILLGQSDVSGDLAGAERDQMDGAADPAAGPFVQELQRLLNMIGSHQHTDRGQRLDLDPGTDEGRCHHNQHVAVLHHGPRPQTPRARADEGVRVPEAVQIILELLLQRRVELVGC